MTQFWFVLQTEQSLSGCHSINEFPCAGVAVKVTFVPKLYAVEQELALLPLALLQFIPCGLLVIVPCPWNCLSILTSSFSLKLNFAKKVFPF